MRVSWYSNAPWFPTGYGTQTASVVRRIKEAGHDIAVIANVGVHGMTAEWEGIPVFPGGQDAYSNDLAPAHHAKWTNGDLTVPVITLYDTWPLDPQSWAGLNIASWTPVDHLPPGPNVIGWAKQIASKTIAMSQFGQKALAAAGVESVYIPHGVETTIYKPDPEGAAAWREAQGIPADAFVVGIVAANQGNHPPRKGWSEMLQAVAHLMKRHDDVYLYLHTSRTGFKGIDLGDLLDAIGISGDRVRFVSPYAYGSNLIPSSSMAAIYSGFDVLLLTSLGEGFGLPVLEAQACGVPVIVSDWTAQPELVGAGWTVPVQPLWDAPHHGFFGTPIIPEIVERLDSAHALMRDPEVASAAVGFAAKYDHDRVFTERWVPFLASLEAQPESRQERRAKHRKGKR